METQLAADLTSPHRKLTGSCLCGALQYAVDDELVYAANCHCSNCRKTTGSAFKPFVGIEFAKFSLTKGNDKRLIFGSEMAHDVHCKTCGSIVYSVVRDGQFIHVPLGTLTDEPTIRLSEHIFVASEAFWFVITDDLPQYDGHVTGTRHDAPLRQP